MLSRFQSDSKTINKNKCIERVAVKVRSRLLREFGAVFVIDQKKSDHLHLIV